MILYYTDPSVTIYHGDCRDITDNTLGITVDAIIADPPYNVGRDYGAQTNDLRSAADYERWTSEWFTAVRCLAWKMVVFPGLKRGCLEMWLRTFKPSAIGCWYKNHGSARTLIGINHWEPWLYWCGDKGALGGSDVIHFKVETVRMMGSREVSPSHPGQKPIDLLQRLIGKLRCDVVLDPFMGSGTTLIAAKNLGLRAVGIELEEKYCEVAANRCSQEVLDLVGA